MTIAAANTKNPTSAIPICAAETPGRGADLGAVVQGNRIVVLPAGVGVDADVVAEVGEPGVPAQQLGLHGRHDRLARGLEDLVGRR